MFYQSPNINTFTGPSGKTALIVAAEKGNLDIVKVLIKADADVNTKFGGTYLQQVFRILRSLFQVLPMKQRLSLQRGMETGASSNFSLSRVLM